MRITAITINLDLTLRDYARANSMVVGMKLGSGLMFMVSVEGIAAAVRAITAGFQRLPDILKLVIGLAAGHCYRAPEIATENPILPMITVDESK